MLTTFAGFALCLVCQAPQEKPMPAADVQSVDHLPPALRIEAGRLGSTPSSPLFAALSERKGDASAVGLSKDQLQLILEMDATARKTLRRWLVRPRHKGSPPLKVEDLTQAKAFVVGHMEAIFFECVLTPRQAADWRKLASKPVMPLREGHYSFSEYPPDAPHPETQGGYLSYLHNLAMNQNFFKGNAGGCSDIFRLFLDVNQTMKWGDLPDLTGEQKELARRVNAIACDAQKLWLLRGILGLDAFRRLTPEQNALPPSPAMRSRASESGRRLRASVVSHAEELLLGAVLEPSQRTEIMRRFWINQGPRALIEPELSSILRISQWQRETISMKLVERGAYMPVARMNSGSVEFWKFYRAVNAPGHIMTAEERKLDQTLREANDRNYEQLVADYDLAIWDVLSTAQSRTLAKILRKPIPKKEDEKTKKKSSRAG